MNDMNITSAQYMNDPVTGEAACIIAVIDGVTMSVPLDTTNRHYAEIMQQVEAGNLTIQAAD